MCIRDRCVGTGWGSHAVVPILAVPDKWGEEGLLGLEGGTRGDGVAGVRHLEHSFVSVREGLQEITLIVRQTLLIHCLLYTSDAADEEDSVDLGGRRLMKKKKYTEKKQR
eukprot:TRINITY_DN15075_c0_g2_i1.p1 TRINITY_DN15075_c0_g2~~TRINITY_DN15075_c0_g2_i1.p1  ORF type:complete len:110 (+),score=12.68 TRINITY_DN15075_c0_g2_i1:42-371(+)